MTTTTYAIAPSANADMDLAGPGNEFASFDEAFAAAQSMDASNPLPESDEWIVYSREGSRPWRRAC